MHCGLRMFPIVLAMLLCGKVSSATSIMPPARLDCHPDLAPKVTSMLNTFFYPELVARGFLPILRPLALHVHLASDSPTHFIINSTHVSVGAQSSDNHQQQPHDLLRVLGRLLQELAMRASGNAAATDELRVVLPAVEAGAFATRSHQLGFYFERRTPQFATYVRELAVFGANQVEFAHWKWGYSSNTGEHSHSMNEYCYGGNVTALIEWSSIIDDMGMNMSVWWPVDVYAYDDGKSMEALVAKLKRLDSLFVPGGDGGIVLAPKEFFLAVEKMAALVHKYHPEASIWMSAQEYSKENLTEFMSLAADSLVSGFLTGLAYGPHVVVPFAEFDSMAPVGMPVRQYPDICHSDSAQYEVYQWDPRLAATHGRLVVNPMPQWFYHIAKLRMNASYASHQAGFGAYSEGISDDLNKAIWSSLYADPTRSMDDIVKHFAAYYTMGGLHTAQSSIIVTQLIFALEKTFGGGRLEDNSMNVMNALALATELQQNDPQAVDGNWRLQSFIYRAIFDAYVLLRVQHEGNLIDEAMQMLAAQGGVVQSKVESLLNTSLTGLSKAAKDLKNRTLHMANLLGNTTMGSPAILQCQVPELGVNTIDNRISDVQFVLQLAQRNLLKDNVNVVQSLLNYTNAGPDGFFDAAGSVRADDHPHLDPGQGPASDPSSYFTPIQAVHPPKHDSVSSMPFSWFQYAEVYYDNTLQFIYNELNQQAAYAITVVFYASTKLNKAAPVRIVADGSVVLRDYFVPDQLPVTVAIPASVTSKGQFVLGFHGPRGLAGSGRGGLVTDIWLHRKETFLGVNILAKTTAEAHEQYYNIVV